MSVRRTTASSLGCATSLACAFALALALGCSAAQPPVTVNPFDGSASAWPDTAPPFSVLLFTRTAGFRHQSIPTALAALKALQSAGDYLAETTEDPAQFSPANLARFQVVVFLLTTGDVLDADQQAAFEAWIGAGGNYVGVHSAADTEHDWPFYGTLVGAYFVSHPDVQPASVDLEATGNPIVADLPSPWLRTDEWYNFDVNPRPNVTVLATVDESTYTGGTMGADHPITWQHPTGGGGRAFYTAMGHTDDSYRDPLYQRLLVAGLRWAAGR
jgi:type 1 glutamine amidotransferase